MNNFGRCEGGKLKFMRVNLRESFLCARKKKLKTAETPGEKDNVLDDQSILFLNFS